MAPGTRHIDPDLPIKIGARNGREARESGLSLNASIAQYIRRGGEIAM
jgi:hypothetical protein